MNYSACLPFDVLNIADSEIFQINSLIEITRNAPQLEVYAQNAFRSDAPKKNDLSSFIHWTHNPSFCVSMCDAFGSALPTIHIVTFSDSREMAKGINERRAE